MKQIHLLGVGILLSAIGLSGCSESNNGIASGYGTFSPLIGLDTEVLNSSASRAVQVSADDLSLKLTKPDGSVVTWDKVGDFDPTKKYPVGEYTLEAVYGDDSKEGFELPHYYGTTKFNILEDKESAVALTAKMGNSMISAAYTDAFKNYMVDGSWSSAVRTSQGGSISIPGDETRPVYVKSGTATVTVSFTKADGQSGTFRADELTLAPRTHYVVTFDVDAADATLVVTFNDGMEERVVNIDISKNVFDAPEPEIVLEGFESDVPLEYIENTVSDIKLSMAITALAGIKSVHMTTVSDYLTGMDWPCDLDLVNATDDEKASIQSNGLSVKGLWKNIGEMAYLDFAVLADMLPASAVHTITVTVADVLDRECQPVTLVIAPTELVLELEQAGERLLGADTKVYVQYNGPNAEKEVEFEMQNERGTFTTVKPLEFVPAPEKGEEFYLVTLPTADNEDNTVIVRAFCGNSHSNDLELTLKPPFFSISVKDVDVFSNYAKGTIALLPGATQALPPVKDCTFLISRVGVSAMTPFTFPDGNIRFTGLRPATSYEVWVQYQGMRSKAAAFRTEAQPQIENGDLDSDVTSSGYNRILFDGWGTNNIMTSSQGIEAGYTRNSGTQQTTDAVSGKAAILKTIGWGSGNTNAGSLSTVKYVDPALLHLGANRETRASNIHETTDLDCGIAFTSRPTSMSFYYKYQPKNSSDTGEALIRVIDANGNTIAEAKMDLDKRDAYGDSITLPLTYPNNAAKAAKLYVRFLSSNKTPGGKDGNWINYGNPHTGSVLYIDEITLNY